MQQYLGLSWQGGTYELSGNSPNILSLTAELSCGSPGFYNNLAEILFNFGGGCAGTFSTTTNNISCSVIGGSVELNTGSTMGPCCPPGNIFGGSAVFNGGMIPMANPLNQIPCNCACAASNTGNISTGPVRYSSGELVYRQSDVPGGGGYGVPWGHTRTFAPRLSQNESLGQGYNWRVEQWPYLVLSNPSTIILMGEALESVFFDLNGSQYVARYNVKKTLSLDTVNQVYRVTDSDGSYTDFDELVGMLVQKVDPAGNTLVVTGYNGFCLTQVERTYSSGGQTTVEQWSYTYNTTMGDLLLSSVTLSRQVNGGAFVNVSQCLYTYYGFGSPNGGPEDLETATTQIWSGSAWESTGTCYYRYYLTTGSSSSSSSSSSGASSSSTKSSSSSRSSSSGGSTNPSGGGTFYWETTVHLLKYIVQPATYNQMVASGINPLTASDAMVSLYADFYYQYDSLNRVTLETTLSGSQTYTFAYSQSTFANGYNSWNTKTVETLPDGNRNIVYSNGAGQTMLHVFQSGSSQWLDYYRYDSNANLILKASPSAVNGYSESDADLVNFNSATGMYQYLNTSVGLIRTYTYDTCSGKVATESVQQGQLGTSILLHAYNYICCTPSVSSSSSSSTRSSSSSMHAASSSSSLSCSCASQVYLLSKETAYPSSTSQTITNITIYSYQFYPGTCAVQQKTTTFPVISAAQNGPGIAVTSQEYYDTYGNVTWAMDERGFITHTVYDIPTGAISQLVTDVNTSMYINVPSGWSTPAGGGMNLVTDYLFDSQGRMTQELLPSNTIDMMGTATTLRSAQWTYYDDQNHITYSGQGYATGSSPSYSYYLINPVLIDVTDASGKVEQQIQAASSTTLGSLSQIIAAAGSGAAAFPQSTYTRWTTTEYTDCCLVASRQVYKLIPASGSGSSGVNYDQTVFGYDTLKRLVQSITPGGTITWNVLDPRGLILATYIGTNDSGGTYTDPTGGGAPGNNMVLVMTNVYDGGLAGGDGNVTQIIQHVDATTSRVWNLTYDFRDRQISKQGPVDYFEMTFYDNLDRIIESQRYNTYGPSSSSSSGSSNSSGSSLGNLIAQNQTLFDDRGHVFQKLLYGVDPATGIVGNALTDNLWYDACGNVVKSWPAGSQLFTKMTYDSLGRPTVKYAAYGTDDAYADVLTVASNVVLEQYEAIYDSVSNVIQSNVRLRYHNAPVTQLGALQNPNLTPNARVTYSATYPDPLARPVNIANYGTNGGAALVRPSTAPNRSNLVLVNSSTYDSSGNASTTTDPGGCVTCYTYDAAGRKLTVVQNCTASSSSSSSSSSASLSPCGPSYATNLTTRYSYSSDGLQATMVAVNPVTGDQTTTWTYGTTLSNSQIASSLLLLSVTYPDSAGGSDITAYSYNRQGEKLTLADQRGCVHSYLYDQLGRLTHDCVTTLGSGVDSTVLQLATSYEVRGMISELTSYGSATPGSGTVINDVVLKYNSFAQLIADYQSHTGYVNVGATFSVQYGFANGSTNTIRPTTLTYPNGRVLTYNYGTTGGLTDSLSLIASLIDNDDVTHLADYSYLGQGTPVIASYAQPSVEFTLYNVAGTNDPVTGDVYTGLDSFGRVKDCRWYNSSDSTDVARLKYGYDQDGNRLWRQDIIATSLGHAYDEVYTYDGVQRLQNMQRGSLNSTQTGINSPIFQQCWSLDPTNNWYGFRESNNGSSWAVVQSRASSAANEITNITNSTGPTWAVPAYDAAGNMTTMPQPTNPSSSYTATYDAWNRSMTLSNSGVLIQQNQYDARNARTVRLDYVAGVLSENRNFYYSSNWQSLEEWVSSLSTPERQQVWGLRQIDDLVVRDRDSNAGGILNERLYGLQDANWNMVALMNSEAVVEERYFYSSFGAPTFLNGDMSLVLSSSAIDSNILFTGQRLDSTTSLFMFRHRILHTGIGGFLTRDPILYQDGPNMYAAWFVPNGIDPYGLRWQEVTIPGVCVKVKQFCGTDRVTPRRNGRWCRFRCHCVSSRPDAYQPVTKYNWCDSPPWYGCTIRIWIPDLQIVYTWIILPAYDRLVSIAEWIQQNPGLVIGSLVVLGGTLYVVSVIGSGGLTLTLAPTATAIIIAL